MDPLLPRDSSDAAPEEQDTGRLLARNTVFNLVGRSLPLAVGVLTVPYVISGLGKAGYAILSLAGILTGYFGIFDLGLGRAATRFVARAIGRGEQEKIRELAWTAVMIQGLLGLAGTLILIGLAGLLVERVLNVPAGLVNEARTTFYVFALAIPVTLVSTTFQGVLEAGQRFDVLNTIRTPFGIADFLLPVVGVLLDWGLPGIATLMVASQFLALSTYYLYCIRHFTSLRGLPRFHRPDFRMLLGYGGWVTVSNVVGPILTYSDRFVLGSLRSVSSVAYYAAPYGAISRLSLIPTSLVSTLFPMFSTLGDKGDRRSFQGLASRAVNHLLFVLGPVIFVVVVYADDLLRVWLGNEFADNGAFALQILAVGVLMNSLARVPYSLLQALGRPDLTAKIHFVELPLHLILAWFFVDAWGVTGAALAWSIRVGVDAALLFVVVARRSQLPLHAFILPRARLGAVGIVISGAAVALLLEMVNVMWLRLAALPILGLAMAAALWRYLLDGRERERIRELVHMVVSFSRRRASVGKV